MAARNDRDLAAQEAQIRAALSTDTMTFPGVSPTVAQIEADALAWCVEHGHSQRDRGRQACRDCAQEALMGRLGQQRDTLPPLVGASDTNATYIDGLLASGGVWKLSAILAELNRHRATMGKDPYTETGCSARIRDLRKAGRHINQRVADDGGAEYWNADLVTA